MGPQSAAVSVSHFGHRTNSLGFAKSDCSTCARLKERCDRQRPKCGACVSRKRDCGGFALDLVWKHTLTPQKTTPKARAGNKEGVRDQSPPKQSRPQQLQFVPGRVGSKRRKKTSKSPYSLGAGSSGLFTKFTLEPEPPQPASYPSSGDGDSVSPEGLSSESDQPAVGTIEDWTLCELEADVDDPWTTTIAFNNQLDDGFDCLPQQLPSGPLEDPNITDYSLQQQSHFPPEPFAISDPPCLTSYSSSSGSPSVQDDLDVVEVERNIPAGVTYRNLAHKYGEILASCKSCPTLRLMLRRLSFL